MARRIELCLFDGEGNERRFELPGRTGFYFHGHAAGVTAGQRYAFRVHGPYAPEEGHRCNPHKLLLDPHARAIEGRVQWEVASVLGHAGDDPFGDPCSVDSAPAVPRSVVVDERFDWQGDRRPARAWSDTVIYELHVKGFTARHPQVPSELRGTYAGLAHPAVIEYLLGLGVTAVELLPVHQFEDDAALHARNRSNYWGYASIGYFAPHNGYSSSGQAGGQVNEFKAMVRSLHAAGIEVILDVVYNHTAEGNEAGSTLCFRGLDNAAYYKHAPRRPGRLLDQTGCGNTFQLRHPEVLRLVMDSLRYWVEEMHVDGFRFDLAAALTRTTQWVDPFNAFNSALCQDPTLRDVKMIAEPWDLGSDGYQVGNFSARFSEWNGPFRDSMREFWCKGPSGIGEFARRFSGSSDLYQRGGRAPSASINFITAHDGFTLRDLLTYTHKHNQANGENNRDGESHNRGWNCGAEGPDAPPQVLGLRARQQRNLLLCLFFSQGVPMLLAGDERGRSQEGNNNAYCHDSELTWINWEERDTELEGFVRQLIAMSREHPALRPGRWFDGEPHFEGGPRDIVWYRPDGAEFGVLDWDKAQRRALAVHLAADAAPEDGSRRQAHCLLLLNADEQAVEFTLPSSISGQWGHVLSTAVADEAGADRSDGRVLLPPFSARVYRAEDSAGDG